MFIFHYWNRFYKYSGRLLLLILLLSPIIGLLDGLGLTLLVPLITEEFALEQNNNNSFLYSVKDYFISMNITPSFINIIIIILILIIVKNVMKYIYLQLSAVLNSTFIEKIRLKILELFKATDYSYYIKVKTGYLLNNMTSDVYKYSTTQKAFISAISSLFVIIGYLIFLTINSWKITLSLVIIGYIISYIYGRLNNLAKEYSKKVVINNREFNAKLIETVTYFKYLKATAQFYFFEIKLSKNIRLFSKYQLKTSIYNGLPSVLQEPITVLIIFSLYLLNKYFFLEPISALIAVLVVSYRASSTINQLQSQIQQFYSGIGSMDAVEDLIQDLFNHQQPKSLIPNNIQFNREIKLENISFSYDNRLILDNINLSIAKYSTIAIVGLSGSGKSTLADILCGLLIPNSGSIKIDDINIGHLSSEDWQKKIGYVTQENIIFDGSISDNVCMNIQEEPAKARLMDSLDKANAIKFVNNLTNKENTIVGERGIKLSGGQRQRIAIARELYRIPEILILDEATSSLDSETEELIQKSIDSLKGHFTLIIIAHRLSTIKNVDVVHVLREGVIQESGVFLDLTKNPNSALYELALLQNLT